MNNLTFSEVDAFIKNTGHEYLHTEPRVKALRDEPIRLFDVKIRSGSDMPVMTLHFACKRENDSFKAVIKLNTLSVGVEILDFINTNSRTF